MAHLSARSALIGDDRARALTGQYVESGVVAVALDGTVVPNVSVNRTGTDPHENGVHAHICLSDAALSRATRTVITPSALVSVTAVKYATASTVNATVPLAPIFDAGDASLCTVAILTKTVEILVQLKAFGDHNAQGHLSVSVRVDGVAVSVDALMNGLYVKIV